MLHIYAKWNRHVCKLLQQVHSVNFIQNIGGKNLESLYNLNCIVRKLYVLYIQSMLFTYVICTAIIYMQSLYNLNHIV